MTESKKKILYIGNKLAKHGFSLSSIETLGPLLEEEGFELLYASDQKNQALRLLAMLRSIFRNRKSIGVVLIDTYSSSAFYYAWASVQLCTVLKLKCIPILRGGNLPERMANSKKLTDQVFSNSLTNVIVSDYLKNCMEERNYKYTLIPNNINLRLYNFLHREKIAPRLLWVRAFHTVYNPQLAIRVLKKLSVHYPAITLTMVGPKKDESYELCKKLCTELEVNDKVTFTGKLSKEEWRLVSEKHDIFINTTNFDNLPISVLEAMALGMPVVSTNVGGVPYLINNGSNGLLVNPDSVDQMADAIITLLNDAQLTGTLSRNARLTSELYDWSNIRKKWNELLLPNLSS
jgi:L-malate glycosyltransferase